jgi:hypothetical protein
MTPLTRTSAEIAAQLRTVQAAKTDRHGIESSRYLDALRYADAREWLVPTVTEEAWEASPSRIHSVEEAWKAAVDYLPFAWAKANEGSLNSADRSVAHYRGLAWLLNAPAPLQAKLAAEPTFCGKPQLVAVSEWLGVSWQELDDPKGWRTHAHDPAPLTREQALATLPA